MTVKIKANEITDYPLLAAKLLIFLVVSACVTICYALFSMPSEPSTVTGTQARIIAARVDHELQLDAQHPSKDWEAATPIRFDQDWQGRNQDLERETQVRLLWSPANLYLRFECRYRDLYVFPDSAPDGRRDELWDRDVAEVFLQPDPSRPRYYREFEVSPNGMWIDLDIFPGGLADLKSGMQRSVWIDRSNHVWAAELSIPLRALTPIFDPKALWRVNFYRVEGQNPRKYLAWRPTNTPEPNFHVPEAFGTLVFETR